MKNIQLLIVCYLLFSSILLADIINVPADTSTIQGGIHLATDGDTVLVAEDTYFENINFKGKAITVASQFIMDEDTSHISKTIIDGSLPSNPDSGSVVYFTSGEDTTSLLCGFTITGGTGTVFIQNFLRLGGGILIVDAGAKICNNRVKNNIVADYSIVIGAGIVAAKSGENSSNAFVIIEKNILESNSCIRSSFASHGGGLNVAMNGIFRDNTIKNNLVSSLTGEAFGGGISLTSYLDSVWVYNNDIIHNKAETINPVSDIDAALGGGIMVWNDYTSYLRIIGNFIAYNEVSGTKQWTAAAGVCLEE